MADILTNAEKSEKSEMVEAAKNRGFLTTTQAAVLLGVSPDTILKWVKAGKISSHRTLGGHYRISPSAIELPEKDLAGANYSVVDAASEQDSQQSDFQYCWQFQSKNGKIKKECLSCLSYQSRSYRCYELRRQTDSEDYWQSVCNTSCEKCSYYHEVIGKERNVLILSNGRKLLKKGEDTGQTEDFRIEFAESEYECSCLVEKFRPDYFVIDYALGVRRVTALCRSIHNDKRIPVSRVIISSKENNLQDYCDKEMYGWITRPFTIRQLKSCIEGSSRPFCE